MIYQKDGKLYDELPQRIRLSDGTTRTDSSTYTPEVLEMAGYTIVPDAPQSNSTHRAEWNGDQWVFIQTDRD